MLTVSDSEKKYTQDGFTKNFRDDGRENLQVRNFKIEDGHIKNANSSCRIVFDNNVEILVAVKAEIVRPKAGAKGKGKIEFFLDTVSGGMRSDKSKAEMVEILKSIYNEKSVDLESLTILDNEYVWQINVDVLFYSDISESYLDILSLGISRSLRELSLPNVKAITNKNTGESELVLEDETGRIAPVAFKFKNIPLLLTISIYRDSSILDCTEKELLCVDSVMQIAVTNDLKILQTRTKGMRVQMRVLMGILETLPNIYNQLYSALKL